MDIPVGNHQQLYPQGPLRVPKDAHAFYFGKTGSGKSSIAKNQIIWHIREGDGVCVVDPHGDLVDDLIAHIPSNRTDDVVLWDPSDPDFAFAFNPLRAKTFEQRLKKLLNVVSILSSVFENGWGGASDRNAMNVGYAMLRAENAPTLIHLLKAFTSEEYREKLRPFIDAENVELFFKQFDDEWDKRQRNTAAAPITNKVDFFAQPLVREAIAQYHGVQLGPLMDRKTILLCRFSEGKLTQRLTAVFTSLLLAELKDEALSRDAIPQSERVPFYVYIDEWHATVRPGMASIAEILQELRKYKVFLTGLDQTTGGEKNHDNLVAILGNTDTIGVGRVGPQDAKILADALPIAEPNTLVRMTAHHWYIKTTLEGGIASDPYLIKSLRPPLPPQKKKRANLDSILKRTRTNYCRPRKEVSDHINKILGGTP